MSETSTNIIPGIVTAADVMRQLSDFNRTIGEANTRLAVIDLRTQTTATTGNDHEARIRRLEDFRGRLVGVALTVSIASGAISGLLGWALGHVH